MANRLEGRARVLSGSGLGLYLKFFDEKGALLNVTNPKGHISPAGRIDGGKEGGKEGWQPFSFSSSVPEGASVVRIWIHSFNASRIEAELDDLALKAE